MKTIGNRIKDVIDTLSDYELDTLDREIANLSPSRPPNSFTIAEEAKRKGMSESFMRDKFRKLIAKGKMTRTKVGAHSYYQLVKK